jgi:putative transcriptional regulator
MIALVSESHAGKLLVASPAIMDPHFHRTVVLLCSHDDNGAFGLVLNRPIEDARLSDLLPRWSEHVASPPLLFRGGPVEAGAGFALGLARGELLEAGWAPVIPHVGLLDLSGDPAEIAAELAGSRVFSGYSGWGAGQLEGEIKEGGWFVVEAAPADAFTSEPEQLWREVLRRQRGEMRLFAYFPSDPRAN